MKPIIPFALLGALLAIGANAATTDPVGYITAGNTAGVVAGNPSGANLPNGTDILVSVALLRPTVAASTIDGAPVGQVITIAGGGLGDLTTVPHIFTTPDGEYGLITANDATTITVDGAFDISGLADTDPISIREANTVGNLLEGNTIPTGGNFFILLSSGTDVGVNNAFGEAYQYFGTWFTSSFASADNVVIYPGEAFKIRNTSGSDVASLVITGEVPIMNSAAVARGEAGVQDSPIGYTSPVGDTIGHVIPNSVGQDQLLEFDNTRVGTNLAASAVYSNFGSALWYNSSFTEVTNSLIIGGGKGYIYRRAAGAGDLAINAEPTYISTL